MFGKKCLLGSIPSTYSVDKEQKNTIRFILCLYRFISSVPLTLKGSECKLIQERALNTLLGDPPTYVASFGNSDVNSVGDWVKILNTRPVNEVESEQC